MAASTGEEWNEDEADDDAYWLGAKLSDFGISKLDWQS